MADFIDCKFKHLVLKMPAKTPSVEAVPFLIIITPLDFLISPSGFQ